MIKMFLHVDLIGGTMAPKYGLRNRAVCLVTIFFINMANQLSATPSSDMQTLMDTKTSMLDWGLYRLQEKLRNYETLRLLSNIDIQTTYDAEEDKIIIELFDTLRKPTTPSEVQNACEAIFQTVEEALLVENGKDVYNGKCLACNFFNHNGWSEPKLTEATQFIRGKFQLEYHLNDNSCSRALYGATFAVTAYDPEIIDYDILPSCPSHANTKYTPWHYCFGDGLEEDGSHYEGSFKQGKYHGKGTYYSANGDEYFGHFAQGKFNGFGILKLSNKHSYAGQFEDGIKHGLGEYRFANGDKYTGHFKDDKFHGSGTYTLTNGTVFEGIWENGRFLSD